MQQILDAIQAGDTSSEDFAALDIPESYRAVTVHKDEADMFEGVESRDKDPRKSLHLDDVPLPELGPGEALVAVMASAINYNTVWTSIFEPVSTFGFLERYGRLSPLAKRHDLPYHVVGSDLAGVVLKAGVGVHSWKPGDEVVAHCLSVELESPDGHNDTMLDPEQRIWGFETNFGGLAEIALVKSNQLMPKPDHLTWEEAASPGLVNSTAYRQLVSRNGAGMKQGDNVLIWGASGGLGGFATQYALNGGATPICVVSNDDKAQVCRSMGAELVINRSEEDWKFWKDEHDPGPEGVAPARRQDPRPHRRRGRRHRLRAPGPRDLRRVGVRRPQGRHHRHLRLHQRLHAHLRQPLPVDEPQADHRLALRQLPRVVGGQPADRQGPDPPDPLAHLRPRGRRPGGAGRPPATPTRARSGCSAWPPRRVSACATRTSAASISTRSTGSAEFDAFAADRTELLPRIPPPHGLGWPSGRHDPGARTRDVDRTAVHPRSVAHRVRRARAGPKAKEQRMPEGRGLSIFDDEPEGDSEQTQVIPVLTDDPSAQESSAKAGSNLGRGTTKTAEPTQKRSGNKAEAEKETTAVSSNAHPTTRPRSRSRGCVEPTPTPAQGTPAQTPSRADTAKQGAPAQSPDQKSAPQSAPPSSPPSAEQPARRPGAATAPAQPASRRTIIPPASRPQPAGQAFPQVRRGYDKDAVDRRMLEVSGERDGLAASLTTPTCRSTPSSASWPRPSARPPRPRPRRTPGSAAAPASCSGSPRSRPPRCSRAPGRRPSRSSRAANQEATATRAKAERDAEDMRVVQLRDLDETRTRTMGEIEQSRDHARAEADDIRGGAQREADQIRLGAKQEVESVRTAGAREAEHAKAAVDREVQEARRALAVEKERLTREAVEHHTTVTAETTRLVTEAEERANAAAAAHPGGDDRRQLAPRHAPRARPTRTSPGPTARPSRSSATAKAEAEELRAAGHADHERRLADLKLEVDQLSKRRDGIAAQLGALRDVVSGFEKEADEG